MTSPRDAVTAQCENRTRQIHHPVDGREQGNPRRERQRQADSARLGAIPSGQAVGKNRDEDEVVDAEDNLEHDQQQQAAHNLSLNQHALS
jgi:hypothetical protein